MLIFDFDGTLIDSVDEVAWTVYHYVTELPPAPLDQIDQKFLDSYRNNRFHVQMAGDLVVLGKWCLEKGRSDPAMVLDNRGYEDLIKLEPRALAERTERFFAKRNQLVNEDREMWLALHRPYQPLWSFLIERKITPTILTNKNRQAVQDISSFFDMQIPSELIYSGDNGRQKTENLNNIFENFGLPQVHFIDDSAKNLLELQQEFGKKIICYLANWGYTTTSEIQAAEKEGIISLNQNELISLIDRLSES